jgi:Leucine-rich repeat (LRR) protein
MAAAWPEITQAAEGKRRELVLTGNVLAQRLEASKGEIPKALFKLTELNFIDLSGCRTLTNLPDEAAMLTNLTSLVLAGNAIRSLPGEALSKMTKLKVLDFSNNDLEQVPDQLGQLGRSQ